MTNFDVDGLSARVMLDNHMRLDLIREIPCDVKPSARRVSTTAPMMGRNFDVVATLSPQNQANPLDSQVTPSAQFVEAEKLWQELSPKVRTALMAGASGMSRFQTSDVVVPFAPPSTLTTALGKRFTVELLRQLDGAPDDFVSLILKPRSEDSPQSVPTEVREAFAAELGALLGNVQFDTIRNFRPDRLHDDYFVTEGDGYAFAIAKDDPGEVHVFLPEGLGEAETAIDLTQVFSTIIENVAANHGLELDFDTLDRFLNSLADDVTSNFVDQLYFPDMGDQPWTQ
ncbi:hypothetical protein [Yoonia sp.]|uniref:hypothetical protein n=1 Tax=Yoonia sp. TaxID=2212373 RepID=UPI0025D80A9E|nr:hypothetical protein [Yoonia sp.]